MAESSPHIIWMRNASGADVDLERLSLSLKPVEECYSRVLLAKDREVAI